MPQCNIVVLTSERPPGASYLIDTLIALNAQGARGIERRVIYDGKFSDDTRRDLLSSVTLLGYTCDVDTLHTGNVYRTWQAMRQAKASGVDLLIFEDDVLPCLRGVEAALECITPEDCGFLSFFHPYLPAWPYAGNRRNPATGIYRYPLRNMFAFSQAVKIPYRTLERMNLDTMPDMSRHQLTTVSVHNGRTIQNGRDRAIGMAVQPYYESYGLVVPNWFEHTGHLSAVYWHKAKPKNIYDQRPVSKLFLGDVDATRDLCKLK